MNNNLSTFTITTSSKSPQCKISAQKTIHINPNGIQKHTSTVKTLTLLHSLNNSYKHNKNNKHKKNNKNNKLDQSNTFWW